MYLQNSDEILSLVICNIDRMYRVANSDTKGMILVQKNLSYKWMIFSKKNVLIPRDNKPRNS